MQDHVFLTKDLEYTYRSGRENIRALEGIDLVVASGEIFGFIGPNGAGKTTTIKLLLGILSPCAGTISLFGSFPSDPSSRCKVGYMPEVADYYGYLTPRELLFMYGSIFGMDKISLRARIKDLLAMVGLDNASNRLMRTFSKGMKQKVSFAQALVNDPDLLILDEPASGLDPVSRKQMRQVILDLRDKGKTIFFSSHELSEVELISDRIGILNKGRLLACGPVKDILGNKDESESLESYFLGLIEEI